MKKPFKLPKFNFLGIGIVYMLIYVPQIIFVKVGYTGVSISSRVKGTSRAVFGFTLPIGFMVVPFAWHIEQALHDLFAGLRCRFYKGDGSTETFFIPVALVMYPLFAVVWWVEYLGVKWLILNF
jgi:hypothetical protein